jgi:hypothetical protein
MNLLVLSYDELKEGYENTSFPLIEITPPLPLIISV